jgi:O-antigen ligase
MFLLLVLIFSTALGSFNRFGVAAPMWLLVYALVGYHILTNLHSLIGAFASSWLILLAPLIALLSVFWSIDIRHTATAGFHLFYTTLIGVWVGAVYSPGRMFQALLIATGLGVGASIINAYAGIIPAYSYHGELIGIYAQKNGMGRIIGLLALALFVTGVQLRKPAAALLLMLLLALPLWATGSASSLLVYFAILSLPLVWVVTRAEPGIRLIGIFSAGTALIVSLAVVATLELDIVNQVLDKLGKDATLTGRTVLWAAALQLIELNPVLGIGYNAFWTAPAFSDLMATIQAQGATINGFHNAYLEALVGTGILGGTAFGVAVLATVFRVVQKYLADASIEALGMVYFVMMAVAFSFFDIVLYREHDLNQLLLAAVFTAAYRGMPGSGRRADS